MFLRLLKNCILFWCQYRKSHLNIIVDPRSYKMPSRETLPAEPKVNGVHSPNKAALQAIFAAKARTVTELISIRAKALPDEPILGYPSHDLKYTEYTFSDLDAFPSRLARVYSQFLPVRTSSKQDARVVALLGPSNLDYVITALALSRLGFTVLYLSTRISEPAYLSLLDATGCRHIVFHPTFQKTVSALKAVKPDLEIIPIRGESDYKYEPSSKLTTGVQEEQAEQEQNLDLDEETKKVCWIIHSSGSTGPPKPIYQTHYSALRNYEQNMNMKGFITLPLFHAHGLSSVFRAITSIKKIYMYNASLPLTRQNLLKILHQHQFEIFYGVPYALKLLSETQEGIDALAAMKVVMFGGSACPDALGNLLTEGGVNLVSHYGTTETGQLMTSFRPPGDKAWNYVRVHEQLRPYVRFEERGGNLYELVVLQGWPSKVATNREDGSYATKDLFEPHPSIPEAWKYCGRLDDTIVLMNGEKAIPIAMEQALRHNKLVQEAVMFGAGKDQLGMIIIASELAADMSPEDLLDALWPTIEAENKAMPAYGQLAREMIKILPAGTPYPSTDKGTMIRQAFYRAFQSEIGEVYAQAESRAAGTLVLSEPELRDYLRKKILELDNSLQESDLADDTDLFSLGIDSLQSTRLRASILKDIQLNGNTLPPNVVFEYPTIAKLAAAILSIRDSKTVEARDVIKEMEDLITKYSDFPQHVSCPKTSTESCVVVTGATGSLGAHLVAQLVVRDDISEVCCLVRANSEESARERVVKSMKDRRVYETLSAEQRGKITCYPSNFSKPDLGLGQALYDSLSGKITNLIHCAWSVNFNKNLSSFEADCIAGARHLMLLCLSARQPTPAPFNFCSSVSTVVNTPGGVVPEALPESLPCAQGMGYAQSKLVTEHLVCQAAQKTGMHARVLRIGQIVADTKYGIWNDTEAIPLMLQSATTIGALPALDESPRWLPVDVVATAVMDLSLSDGSVKPEQRVFNVVNPKTFHWTRDLLPALRAAGLSFEEVDQREWIRRLRASNPDPVANPTIKLVEFFASKYDNDVIKRKSLDYVTTETVKLAPVLATVPALSTELVKKFVHHFLETSWTRQKK
ncbi:Non-canonical non-ribosomal peptide synthetase ascB [Exophiala dermatitidis]